MIIQTSRISQAGGVVYLAAHLLDKTDENDRIEILAGDRGALHDAQALAQAKGCRYSVRHLSISPEREMSPADLTTFMCMVDAEFGIGSGRPRLVVRHIKKGRSHFHVAVAEVDPTTLRVLDCRNDFARLEDIARRYEAGHGEHVQPRRADRRAAKVEGFSDIARKRAERVSPRFDRGKLKTAFAAGPAAFHSELKTQGLRLADGDKGAILVDSTGTFVAAASRAAGVKRSEFQKFTGKIESERLIGSQTDNPADACNRRAQHSAAPAAPRSIGDAGRARPHGPVARTAPSYPRHAPEPRRGAQSSWRQTGPTFPMITGRCREDVMLARLNRELDDLLRRALELAEWIRAIFEPEPARLSRRIEQARQKRKSFPLSPADTMHAPETAYDYRRRVTP